MYLLHHEEIESLAKYIPGVKEFVSLTFGQSYLTHMKCLENVRMLSTPIEFEEKEIVPIQFLKALLPDPQPLDRVQLKNQYWLYFHR